ncbi:unnamed protein product [Rhizoctonia solani]|uniref:BTB domain-containing protein n=1 Tax=Rhizoctonia solani TaxID=456999 RepID=A0A8H3DFY8_9AGAM|nr:unnamed protein product [Rhizoctonia solani]
MSSNISQVEIGLSMSLPRDLILPGRARAGNKIPPPTKRHSKFYFDGAMVVIKIDNTLFKVHKSVLLQSETFSDMFGLPNEAMSDLGEGSVAEHPIVLNGISVSDFEALLQVLYANRFSTNQLAPSPAIIIPAFRLANMWHFEELCAHLRPIAEKMFSDVDRIVFARQFQLDQWIIPAHINLCQRKTPLNSEEASKIGLQSLLFISRVREEMLKNASRTMSDSVIRAKADNWIKSGCKFAT